MDDNDLISVKEYAQAAGISQQAVYKQLNNRLNHYLVLVKGKKMLNKSVLEQISDRSVFQPEIKQVEQSLNKQLNADFMEILKQQLEIKDSQIAAQAKQLAEVHELLSQAQKLHLMDKQKILELERKAADVEQAEEPQKEKWWQRFFNKNN